MPMRVVFVTILIVSMAIRPAPATASMVNARIAAHYKPKFVSSKSIPFHAVVGVFYVYVYSDDVLRITTNNNLESGPKLAVANCAGAETILSALWPSNVLPYLMGSIGFGVNYGRTPRIGPDLARSTTWGRMKSAYKVSLSR